MALSEDDVREILRLIDESELDELRIERPGFKLHVRRGSAPPAEEEPAFEPAAPPASRQSEQPSARPASRGRTETIEAPMLGTFYSADGPNAEPFVEVGARVEPDTVVAIIEVMKMMNSVRAGVEGTVVEVCAENAELVKEGAPLFRVEVA
jgi:acetyl-CoA carboxylase biotin carboxyl carrier protein